MIVLSSGDAATTFLARADRRREYFECACDYLRDKSLTICYRKLDECEHEEQTTQQSHGIPRNWDLWMRRFVHSIQDTAEHLQGGNGLMSALPRLADDELFASAEQEFGNITTFLRSQEAVSLTHSDLERELEAKGRELMRQLLQAHLNLREPGAAVGPVRDAEGEKCERQQLHERKLETIFGVVTVSRTGYGAEGKPSLHPLDGDLNLPVEKYSHEVRRRAAIEAAKNSFEEGVRTLKTYTGAHVPKRQFEELADLAAQDFEAFYEQRQAYSRAAPNTGNVLVLTVDGKGVVMLPEDLRDATRRAAAKREKSFTARLAPGRRLHAKRMASVAAVYSIEPFVRTPEDILGNVGNEPEQAVRPRPEHKRVWASLEHTPEEVITAMFDEAEHRDPRHGKTWVALVDGNLTQLDILQKAARQRNIALNILVDFIHVAQYVWKASLAFYPGDHKSQDAWVLPRLLEILRGKAGYVAGGMRRSATLQSLKAADRKPIDVCADYLLHYASFLRYDEALTAGLPIATGVIEGACRHLVEDRMNVTGARWSLEGGEAVLRLRALRSSGDFDEYWKFHEIREYQRNHLALYADQQAPAVASPKTSLPRRKEPILKLVKK